MSSFGSALQPSGEMMRELPLFPLNVVLFPGARLPLHIFEPRYRQLLVDCSASDECFGMLLPSNEHGNRLEAGAIGTVAEIIFRQPLPDGRANIIVEGRERFAIENFVDDGTPYTLAEVKLIDELETFVPDSTVAELRTHFAAYRSLLARFTDEEIDDEPLSDDPTVLSFQASATLECDLEAKGALLDIRQTQARIEFLIELFERLTPVLVEALRIREAARQNGKGHPDPDAPHP